MEESPSAGADRQNRLQLPEERWMDCRGAKWRLAVEGEGCHSFCL